MKTLTWRNGRGYADGVMLFTAKKDELHNSILPYTIHSTLPAVLPFYAATEKEVEQKSSEALKNFLERFSK